MKITEADHTELELDSYLMQIHNNSCRCGSGERYGLLYEVWIHPTKTRLSGYRELRPAGNGPMRAGVPVAYVEMPSKHNVLCSDCVQTHKVSETAVAVPAVSAQAWAETLKRKYTPEPVVPAKRETTDRGIPAPTAEEL